MNTSQLPGGVRSIWTLGASFVRSLPILSRLITSFNRVLREDRSGVLASEEDGFTSNAAASFFDGRFRLPP